MSTELSEVKTKLEGCLLELENGLSELNALKAQILATEATDRENIDKLNADSAVLLAECANTATSLTTLTKALVENMTSQDTQAIAEVTARLKPLIDAFTVEKNEVGQALMKLARGRSSVSAYTNSFRR